MGRRATRFWAIAALLPALLLASVGRGYAVYRCRMDLVARTSCCCPTVDEEHHEGRDSAIGEACCCDRELVSFASAVSHTDPDAFGAALGPPAVLAPAPRLPPIVARVPARIAPPGAGPPILLLKQSFLI